MDRREIHGTLLRIDTSEKFYPHGFDFKLEDARALSLSEYLERITGDKALVEDYSVNQDGSLFLRIAIHSKFSLGRVAEIQLSSFGHLANVLNGMPSYEVKIIEALKKMDYKYIHL